MATNYTQNFKLENLSKEEYLAIAIEAAKAANFGISTILKDGFKASSGISLSSYGEEINLSIKNNDVVVSSKCTSMQLFDLGKNKKNVNEFVSNFEEIKSKISSEELSEKVKNIEYTSHKALKSKEKEEKASFLSFFKPREGYYITPIIININILIYLLMTLFGVNPIFPNTQDLLAWGADFQPLIAKGEIWRLLTSAFLHIGIFHLLMNMYALFYIGILLEPLLGKTRFLAGYLIAGVAASVTSVLLHGNTVSAGASGAIFGMYGIFLALLLSNLIEKSERQKLLKSIAIFVAINLIYSAKAGIDGAAHIGGLLSGVVIGFAFLPSLKNNQNKNLKFVTILALSLILVFSSKSLLSNIKNDALEYEERIKVFQENEESIIETIKNDMNSDTSIALKNIDNIVFKKLDENIELVEDLDKLNLPKELHQKNKLLKSYCKLKISQYKLLYKSIYENIEIDKIALDSINNEINDKMEEIQKL